MICGTIHLATLAALLLPFASATLNFNTFVDESVVGGFNISTSWGISAPCMTAYTTDIPCDETIISGNTGTKEIPEGACSNQCIDGLRKWRDDLRAKCSADDTKVASSQLQFHGTGQNPQNADGPMGAILIMFITNPKLPLIEQLYFMSCTKDLKTGDLCDTEESYDYPQDGTTAEFNATFCDNTCHTQSAFLATDIRLALYGYEGDLADVAVIKDMCPGIDTSKYPAILSQQSVSSFSFDPSNSPKDSPNGSPNDKSNAKNETEVPDKNAAVSLKGSLWGMGSTFVAVAIAVFVL